MEADEVDESDISDFEVRFVGDRKKGFQTQRQINPPVCSKLRGQWSLGNEYTSVLLLLLSLPILGYGQTGCQQ